MADALSHLRSPTLQRVTLGFLVVLLLQLGWAEAVSDASYLTESPMNGATANLHPDLIIVMGRIEARIKRTLYINSGYRDPQHNHDVGGVENSEHTYDPAQGVDVECKNGADCWLIVNAALAEGIVRIGIGRNFVHIGISKDKPQNVIWNYYPKPKQDVKPNA